MKGKFDVYLLLRKTRLKKVLIDREWRRSFIRRPFNRRPFNRRHFNRRPFNRRTFNRRPFNRRPFKVEIILEQR